MITQVSQLSDDNSFCLSFRNNENDYILWQQEKKRGNIYFEARVQCAGGNNIVKECTIMRDGIHIVISSGETVHFYFNGMSLNEYLEVISVFRMLYTSQPHILEIFDA